jgi:hypothetical protein
VHIGIDESGNFTESGERVFLVASFVRPGRSEQTAELLRTWERSLPPEYRTSRGEVKGHLLEEPALLSFVDEVLRAADPPVRYYCAGVDLDDATFEAIEGQQTHTAQQMQAGIEMYRNQGKDFFRIANRYENMLGWWNNLNREQVLHVVMLTHMIPTSLNFAIGWSVAHGFDDELGELRFKVDESFISASDEKKLFWRDMLRSHLWQDSVTRGGIMTIKEWDEDHPFLTTFFEKDLGDGRVQLTHEFKDRIDFYKSHETFEIRLADIVGSILRRMDPPPSALTDLHVDRSWWRRLVFTGQEIDVPSPYESQ